MSSAGLSNARVARLHDVMAGYVERGEVPGLVTLVSRRGETHIEALGMKALGGSDPVQRDTIFRIASMTKPVTAAAAMILVEECKLRLDDPVDGLLPELADRQVLKRLDGPLDDTEPAKRAITLRDLLTLRMGFGMLMVPPDTYPSSSALPRHRARNQVRRCLLAGAKGIRTPGPTVNGADTEGRPTPTIAPSPESAAYRSGISLRQHVGPGVRIHFAPGESPLRTWTADDSGVLARLPDQRIAIGSVSTLASWRIPVVVGYAAARFRGMKRDAVPGMSINGRQASV